MQKSILGQNKISLDKKTKSFSRKRQYLFTSIKNLYFAGKYDDNSFPKNHPNYLKELSKEVLYKSLTEYANLVLLSWADLSPLVIREAMICGLGKRFFQELI